MSRCVLLHIHNPQRCSSLARTSEQCVSLCFIHREKSYPHTHTHTHTYIYIYTFVQVGILIGGGANVTRKNERGELCYEVLDRLGEVRMCV
jgi:hypothetical protein